MSEEVATDKGTRHCMVSWGIKAGLTLTDEQHGQLKKGLVGYAFVEAFPGTYVVILTPGDERKRLVGAIRAQIEDMQVQLLISPEMPIGPQFYNGALPEELWTEINRRASRRD